MTKKIILHWNQLQAKGPVMSEAPDTWSPNTDVCEGRDTTVVRMELPGVLIENLDVRLHEHTLYIRGDRPDPACEESAAGYRFRQLEIQYGPFERAIPMPYPVDGEKAQARITNGILEIRLPRAQADKQKQIKVQIDG